MSAAEVTRDFGNKTKEELESGSYIVYSEEKETDIPEDESEGE